MAILDGLRSIVFSQRRSSRWLHPARPNHPSDQASRHEASKRRRVLIEINQTLGRRRRVIFVRKQPLSFCSFLHLHPCPNPRFKKSALQNMKTPVFHAPHLHLRSTVPFSTWTPINSMVGTAAPAADFILGRASTCETVSSKDRQTRI